MARKFLTSGHYTKDHRLDRVPFFDPRSRNYRIGPLHDGKPIISKTWDVPMQLDQGNNGACVSFSWHHELIADPVEISFASPQAAFKIAMQRYHEMQLNDEFPDTPPAEGTTVLAGAKEMKRLGYIGEYRWAFSLDEALLALCYEGPFILGTNWYANMMDTNRYGRVRPSGSMVGGHAILVYRVDKWMRHIWLKNSWGSDWGINGSCYLTFGDFQKLLDQRGEVCVPMNRKLPT